ncbi:MAG: sigma-70 family RNA polymerase sigma factor [bacterium]
MSDKSKEEISARSDLELFEQMADKQSWALAALYDRHASRLFGLALKILKDPTLAEDALQDVFLHIWRKAALFNQKCGNPLGWMFIVCRNSCIDKLRAKERAYTRSSFVEDLMQQWHWGAGEDPFKKASDSQLQEVVVKALEQLSVEQRTPIEMAFFEGFTQSEIAKELELPLGTIKTRIRLGMRKLRNLMQAAIVP